MDPMEMAKESATWAHVSCNCSAPPVSAYCSDYCEKANSRVEAEFRCGHPECEENGSLSTNKAPVVRTSMR